MSRTLLTVRVVGTATWLAVHSIYIYGIQMWRLYPTLCTGDALSVRTTITFGPTHAPTRIPVLQPITVDIGG